MREVLIAWGVLRQVRVSRWVLPAPVLRPRGGSSPALLPRPRKRRHGELLVLDFEGSGWPYASYLGSLLVQYDDLVLYNLSSESVL